MDLTQLANLGEFIGGVAVLGARRRSGAVRKAFNQTVPGIFARL